MRLFRPFDNIMYDIEANWISTDPIIPYGVIAVSIDTKGTKTGDGITKWSSISCTSGSIGSKLTTSRTPVNNEIVFYNSTTGKWDYRLQGIIDTVSNWTSNNTIYPTFSLLVEVTDSGSIPTGRIKVSDGKTASNSISWTGFNSSSFPTGYGLEFNGTNFEATQFQHKNTLPIATTPSGKFVRDDGTWAIPGSDYIVSVPSSGNNNIIVFDGTDGHKAKDSGIPYTALITSTGTPNAYFQINSGVKLYDIGGELHVKDSLGNYSNIRSYSMYTQSGTFSSFNLGGFPTEPTSVTLTSDGTYLYVDGSKVFSQLTGVHGSGSIADMLDGYHATQFATHEDITNLEDTALIYSIVFGV